MKKSKAKIADLEAKIKAKKKEGQQQQQQQPSPAVRGARFASDAPVVIFFVCVRTDEALEAELAVEQAKIKDLLEKAEKLRKEMDHKQAQLRAAKKQGQPQTHTKLLAGS